MFFCTGAVFGRRRPRERYNGAMSYNLVTLDNADAVLEAALARLSSQCGGPRMPVALTPTAAAALRLRRAFSEGPCAIGVRAEALDTWVADRWELLGDGRRPVRAGERELLVRRACGDASGIEATPGTVELLARLAREALPLLPGADGAAGLSAGERAALDALSRYALLLEERSLCELSQAASLLAGLLDDPPPLVVVGFDEVPPAYQGMLERFGERGDVLRLDDGCRAPSRRPERAPELDAVLARLFRPVGDDPVKPTGAVRFALPAGRYAAPRLVASCATGAAERERPLAREEGRAPLPVAVASRDPRALFDSVADALEAKGVSCAASATRPFAETAYGKAFLALCALLFDEPCPFSRASDFALGPFSGMGWRAACAFDSSWRGDRAADREGVARALAAESDVARGALFALGQGDVEAALSCLEEAALHRADLGAAFRAEQAAAARTARSFADACRRVGEDALSSLPLLERASVPAGACVPDGEEAPEVVFLSLSEAAERGPCSFSSLLACDLDAASYPVRAAEDGASLLLERLSLARPADALSLARKRFFRALSSARGEVVLERPLNTVDADEAYPAVMFEELTDCYRSQSDGFAADRETGLPPALVPYALRASEAELQADLAFGSLDEGRAPLFWPVPSLGEVSAGFRERVVVPTRSVGGRPAPVLSPSALESYLECPCKWFALRRLRLSEPDAGFGPLEMGSFSHGVLRSFYSHFREQGHPKVDDANLPAARSLMRETFERHLGFQRELRRSRNPLVPRTKIEEAEAAGLGRRLEAYLDREARLLPGFEPAYLELDFGGTEPFSYAGCLLRGSVDRIDVNGRGQAVVIDYKGSLSADHALSSASPAAQAGGAMLPHKVQALAYAQAVRRLLGLDVVGAVYVSYGRDARVAGAVDRTVLDGAALPGLSLEACGVPGPAGEALGVRTLSQLADEVEERVSWAVRALLEGDVAPDPRGADPCGHCPVLACEKRRRP